MANAWDHPLIQKGLTLHSELVPDIVTVHDPDGVGDDIRFLHRTADLIEIVTR